MKKKTKIIIGILIITVGVLLVYKFGEAFAPGSYPYAEVYKIDAPEENVIKAIKQFKTSHSEFVVPNVTPDGADMPTTDSAELHSVPTKRIKNTKLQR
ncbi:hypothetical protein [Flavobacterium sp.]|jgi:hypothetical protein|uniref:hypothetical protein n=1 Tax=Flavobacterium sp. TaxID=239 RepID=UPI003BEB22A4